MSDKQNPVRTARSSLQRVGERWSILILRECFHGATRFDEFQQRLGVAPNILTCRLNTLVAEGLLVRCEYCKHPPRHEYLLTEAGRDFRPVLLALRDWGAKHLPPAGETDNSITDKE
jgi:DNA-binding HxlR family transcriptional regulator